MSHLPRFTNAGKALQLRALDGERIVFTKMQIGQGELGDTSIRNLTQLIDPKETIPINSIRVEDGYAAIRGYFKNSAVTEGFYYRELGLFAQDPDDATKEILYCYSNTGDKASYITDASSSLIERSIKIIAVVDDAENVTATINGSAVYPDFTDLREAIEAHNDDAEAHQGIVEKEMNVYVDSNTVEDESLRDGTIEHPYQNIDEAFYNMPDTVRHYMVNLKRNGKYIGMYETFDGYYTSLETLEFCSYGSTGNAPIVTGLISVHGVDEVNITGVWFIPEEGDYSHWGTSLQLINCNNCSLYDVVARYNSAECGVLLDAYHCKILLGNVKVYDAQYAISAYEGSEVSFYGNSEYECDTILLIDGSTAYMRIDIEGTIEMTSSSLVLTREMIEKLSDGTFLSHLDSTANPHHVSLDQAKAEGGLIDVAHGGTGQKTFPEGSVLIGKGTKGIGNASGSGVLCCGTGSTPSFSKTLPVNMGGTGAQVFTTNRIIASGSNVNDPLTTLLPDVGALYFKDGAYHHDVLPVALGGTGQKSIVNDVGTTNGNTGGVAPGNVVIPGTDILIAWGKVVIDISEAGKSYTTMIKSSSAGRAFANADYALVISGKDDDWSDLSKTANSFTLTTQNVVGSVVADWIAIGKVAS